MFQRRSRSNEITKPNQNNKFDVEIELIGHELEEFNDTDSFRYTALILINNHFINV